MWKTILFILCMGLEEICGQGCITGYEKHSNEKCYRLVIEKSTWTEGRTYCDATGGHLVILDNAIDANEVEHYLNTKDDLITNYYPGYDYKCVWTDGNNFTGKWHWSSTLEDIKYNNWHPGQPSDSDSSCLCLWGPFRYGWGACQCEAHCNVFCESKPYQGGQIIG